MSTHLTNLARLVPIYMTSFFDNQLIMGFVAAISKITLGHIVIALVFFFFFFF
jgi:hypothetical protein